MNHDGHAKKHGRHAVIMAWSWPCFAMIMVWSWQDHAMAAMFFQPGKTIHHLLVRILIMARGSWISGGGGEGVSTEKIRFSVVLGSNNTPL